MLLRWINDILEVKRIIVRDIVEDLYDGQVLGELLSECGQGGGRREVEMVGGRDGGKGRKEGGMLGGERGRGLVREER